MLFIVMTTMVMTMIVMMIMMMTVVMMIGMVKTIMTVVMMMITLTMIVMMMIMSSILMKIEITMIVMMVMIMVIKSHNYVGDIHFCDLQNNRNRSSLSLFVSSTHALVANRVHEFFACITYGEYIVFVTPM